jgi:hypothetical protein
MFTEIPLTRSFSAPSKSSALTGTPAYWRRLSSRILAEAFFLRREAKRNRGEEDYASESIEELDLEFGRLKPDIPELLARYFRAHPESFPV